MSHFTVVVCLPPMAREKVADALTEALAPFDENLEVEQYTEEDGETYMRNPQAKWDWWVIGGRWRGYFVPAEGANEAHLIYGESGVFDNKAKTTLVDGREVPKVDGGLRRALDFEAMRNEAAAKAAKDWHEYADAVAGTAQPTPWADFVTRVDGGLFTIEQARQEYHAQERIAVLRKHPTYRQWLGPEDTFEGLSRDEYVLQQVARAVPGYATLRADGRWLAPGEMGWFGMSDDNRESYDFYAREANAYLDSLSADSWLVMVDAHI